MDWPLAEAVVPALSLAAFRDELGDSQFALLLDYWLGLCDGPVLPGRRDIDPGQLKPILPYLYMLERTEDGGLRFRLAGTAMRELFAQDITNQTLDEVLPQRALRNAKRCYETVDRLATVWLTRILYDLGQGDRYRYGRLVCPLASDGRRIDAYLGAFETTDIYFPAAQLRGGGRPDPRHPHTTGSGAGALSPARNPSI